MGLLKRVLAWRLFLLACLFLWVRLLSSSVYYLELCLSSTSNKNDAGGVEGPPFSFPRWMTDYMRFHQGNVVRNNETAEYEYNPPLASSSPGYLQWSCGEGGRCGGLGDRLKGMVNALFLAMLTNRTLIIADWAEGGGLVEFLAPPHHGSGIQWNVAAGDKLPLYNTKLSLIDQGTHPFQAEPCTIPASYGHIAARTNIFQDDDLMKSECWQQFLKGYKGDNGVNDRSLFAIGFWALFRFQPIVEQHAAQLASTAGMALAKNSNQELAEYVGVHIRTGQGASWADPIRHGSDDATIAMFYRCASKLQAGIRENRQATCDKMNSIERNQQRVANIYVASDNNEAKIKFLAMDRSHDKTAKAVTDMDILHIDRSQRRWRSKEGGLTVWSEFKLLLDSTCLVYSQSGFSELAALLGRGRCTIRFDQCHDNDSVAQALNRLPPIKDC